MIPRFVPSPRTDEDQITLVLHPDDQAALNSAYLFDAEQGANLWRTMHAHWAHELKLEKGLGTNWKTLAQYMALLVARAAAERSLFVAEVRLKPLKVLR